MLPFRASLLVLILGNALPKPAEVAPLPPASLTLRLEVPDLTGPWKMIVKNEGKVPVRLAADGRLLSFEIQPVERAEEAASPKKLKKLKKGPPPAIVCKLPAELRPSGVVFDRVLVLPPGTRYEEVFSPSLFCFNGKAAEALAPGSKVVAKLGFASPLPAGKKMLPLSEPFVAEPLGVSPAVAPIKELQAEAFVLPAAPAESADDAGAPSNGDPKAAKLELVLPTRVDAQNELTVGMTFGVKNTGGRTVPVHVRRDSLVLDVDGPGGSAECGFPSNGRTVARDLFSPLAAGASKSFDVWVGEMCPDVVFDRPGIYRVRATLAFPNNGEPFFSNAWTSPVKGKEPILVRVREGKLPFYTSPPQALGDGQ